MRFRGPTALKDRPEGLRSRRAEPLRQPIRVELVSELATQDNWVNFGCSHPYSSGSVLFRQMGSALGTQELSRAQEPNLSAARAFALAASSSRFLGGALVSRAPRKLVEIPVIASTAAWKAASFAFDGLLNPLIFLTNWSAAARISSFVTGGSKLNRVLIFLHKGGLLEKSWC